MRKNGPEIPDAPPPQFEGFTDGTFKFLRGLKKNNNKAWFEAHRSDYEETLRNPSKALVEAMAAQFRDLDLPFVASVKSSLFRINRDIRFSNDKSPYKTHIGLSFQLDGTSKESWSGLYLGFEPAGGSKMHVFLGGGIYQPMAEQLKNIRAKIALEYQTLEKLLADKAFQREFPKGLTGESLKRMPRGYAEDHPAADFLKMKQFLFGNDLDSDALLDEDLPKILGKKFKVATPIARFLGE